MSKPNIAELQNLLEKTTKGDWKVENDGGAPDNYIITNSEDVDVIASIMSQGESFVIGDLSDLEFIVKAKNNLPALFKYIEELETKNIARQCAELAVQAPIDWQISCGNRKRFDIHDVRNFQKTMGKLIHDLIVEKFGVEKEKLLGDPIPPKPKNEASDD